MIADATDISVHPQSFTDRKGRLFQSGGAIFRGIPEDYAAFYEGVLNSSVADNFYSAGLVGTERSQLEIDGYPLVLQHERIDFTSYWLEWSSLMLRDAAITICNVNLELMREGYGILDCHPWNVLYDFSRPTYVDFAAIIPLEERWLDEMAGRMRNYWVLPLTFIAKGHPWFARTIRKTPDVGDPLDDLLKRRELLWFPWWYSRLRRHARKRPLVFFERLKSALAELPLPLPSVTEFRNGADGASRDELEHRTVKRRTVLSLLEKLQPQTLLDIGCGDGRYSLLAEQIGAKVIALDADEDCINSLYLHVKSHRLRILPLFADFTVPTPSHGRKCEFPSAMERLVCEVSLALGLIHHLVFDLDISFERIARLLAAHTEKFSVVEFIGLEDAYVVERMEPNFEWYGMDNFIRAMEQYFRLIEVFESDENRKILLFGKR